MPDSPQQFRLLASRFFALAKERTESGGATSLRRDGRYLESTRRRSKNPSTPGSSRAEVELGRPNDLPNDLKLRLGEYA